MSIGANSHFDLKVGYACNNKCVHCVVETNRLHLVENNINVNQSYREIVEIIESEEFKKSTSITITGGEPTLRKDFTRIIKCIVDRYPTKNINIQTNGRLLGQHLPYLKSISNNISYTIAMHSKDEDLHNAIVNTGGVCENNNPFKETLDSLNKLKEVYGHFTGVARIEIVISSMNYKTLPDTVRWLMENGFDTIGMSYPHLDGFYESDGVEKVKEIGLSYAQMKEILPELYDIAKNNKNVRLLFEEVPMCMWRDREDKLLPSISNIDVLKIFTKDVFVKFINHDLINFNETWENIHGYTDKCFSCVHKPSCEGVWYESIAAFGDEGFIPIAAEEYKIIKENTTCF